MLARSPLLSSLNEHEQGAGVPVRGRVVTEP
jgi:hypothetical protein